MTAPVLIGQDNAVYTVGPIAPQEPRRSPLVEVLRVLRRNLGLIGTVAVIVIIIGAAITFSLTKLYTATATVVVSQALSDPLASPDAQAPRLDDSIVETMAVVFKSRDLAQIVVNKIGYEAQPKPAPWWQTALCAHADSLPQWVGETYCRPPAPPSLLGRVDSFVSHLTIEPVGRSRAVTLSFTSEDPALAAQALNELILAEEDAERQAQTAQVNRAANWLDERSAQLRERWLQAEQRVSKFRVDNGLTQTAAGGGAQPLILQQIGDATSALSQAQSALAAANARATTLQRAAQSDRRGLIRMAEQPVISAAANALNELYIQRAKLTQQYGADYPAVATLSRQIAQGQSNLNVQVDAALQAVRSEELERQAQVDSLTKSLDALRSRFSASNSRETEVQALEGEAKGAQLSYQSFLAQSQRFVGRSDLQQPTMSVVAYAHEPEAPSFPRKSRFLLAAALFGLVAGAALAFTREHLWPGFTEISRVGAALSLPLLATIEMVKPGGWRGRRSLARYVARRPLSAAAESARSMLASISLVRSSTRGAQVVSIASVTSNEGKSIISLWLASVAAKSGHKVLVIDCDHRAGSVAKNLQGSAGPGLVDVLSGRASFADVIQVDKETGIHFIPSDRSGLALDGGMALDRIRAKLEELKQTYKLIVLDTPPLLATSDALLYCSASDQTVFVCRWRSTAREAVAASLARLQDARAQITGIVMSMVPPRQKVNYSDTILRRDQIMLNRYYGE